MKQSFLPKPLIFKEWKEHRWWIVTAFALSLHMPYANLLALLQSSSTSSNANVLWRVLVPALYGLHYTPSDGNYPVSYTIHGAPAVSATLVIVAMGLMIALITVERNRGSLWYTASFPIRRKDTLRVKVFLALATVLSALILDFLLLLVCDFISGHAVPTVVLLQWFGQNLLIISVMMALGLLAATVLQAGVAAGLTALLLSAFCGLLGYRAYLHAPLENASSFVQFPRVLPWFLWGVCGAISFLLINATTASNTRLNHTPYMVLAYWIASWLATGLLGTLLLGIRRARSRSPLEP